MSTEACYKRSGVRAYDDMSEKSLCYPPLDGDELTSEGNDFGILRCGDTHILHPGNKTDAVGESVLYAQGLE